MNIKSNRAKILSVIILASISASAWAFLSCRETCERQYRSSVQSCKAFYDQTDEDNLQEKDPKGLQDCLENANIVYQNCLQDCQG
jgi:hypothetical protein